MKKQQEIIVINNKTQVLCKKQKTPNLGVFFVFFSVLLFRHIVK